MELGRDMSVEQLVPRATWEEYLRLEPPPGMRLEFDEGRLIVSPTGSELHDLLIAVLLGLFERYEEETGGRYCVAFPPHSFFMPPGERDYQPDVGVITDARKDRPLGGTTSGAPDLAIEVLSPSTARFDRGLKAARYFEQGASEYWLFDAKARTVEQYRRGDDGWTPAAAECGRYETPLLPGFVLDLADLWHRLDRKLRRG
jgi:Uma2 family endonuclease